MTLKLTPKQYDWLLHPINPDRVGNANGQSHVEAWDVRRTLTQIFGFGGWEVRTKALSCVAQIDTPPDRPNGKTRHTVIYRAEVALIIHGQDGTTATYEDGATGDAPNLPSLADAHDMAMKTALSQALKRCAVNLGDQFGLSLYNGGRVFAVVKGTFVPPDAEARADAVPPPPDEAPVQGEPSSHAGTEVDEPIGRGEHPRVETTAERPAPLNVSQTEAQAREQAAADEAYVNRRRIPYVPPAPTTGTVTPIRRGPEEDTIADAGRRGVERARAAQAAEREQARGLVSSPAGVHPPAQPDRPIGQEGDPIAPAAFIDAVLHAGTKDALSALFKRATDLPNGPRTNLRPHLPEEAVQILAPLAARHDAGFGGETFPRQLIILAGWHLDDEGGMSVRDHVNAEAAFAAEAPVDPTATPQGARP